ncbi:MAG: hypothetical protein ACWA5L_05080 [bacterium]
MKKILTASLLIALIGLTGCTSLKNNVGRRANLRNPAPCPNVVVLDDAARKIEFSGEQSAENVAWTAEILNIRSACRYFEDDPIEAQIDIDFSFGRGPAATGTTKNMTYFVAVTRTNRDLIAKEEFTIPVKFSGGRNVVSLTDSVNRISIPRKDNNISGVNFEIVVGLKLDKQQVIYNRSGKSLKFPDL